MKDRENYKDTLEYITMQTIVDLVENYYVILDRKGYSRKVVAGSAGISESELSSFLKGQNDVSIRQLIKLAKAIDKRVKIVLVDPKDFKIEPIE